MLIFTQFDQQSDTKRQKNMREFKCMILGRKTMETIMFSFSMEHEDL